MSLLYMAIIGIFLVGGILLMFWIVSSMFKSDEAKPEPPKEVPHKPSSPTKHRRKK